MPYHWCVICDNNFWSSSFLYDTAYEEHRENIHNWIRKIKMENNKEETFEDFVDQTLKYTFKCVCGNNIGTNQFPVWCSVCGSNYTTENTKNNIPNLPKGVLESTSGIGQKTEPYTCKHGNKFIYLNDAVNCTCVSTQNEKTLHQLDMVNHPPYYTQGKYEVINVLEDWKLELHEATAVKYIARAQHKGSRIKDLQKAVWYLNRKIQLLEKENGL